MAKPTDFAYHLTKYLQMYLPGRKNYSINTIHSYRDTFKLLLTYLNDVHKIPIGRVTIQTLSKDRIDGFLDWLKKERGSSVGTLKQRLAAIHAFFKYLQKEEPSALFQYQQILSITIRETPAQTVGYLSEAAIKAIISEPDINTRQGRRDFVMLSVLYDTAARVQELCDLRVRDLRLTDNPCVLLTGKGGKSRYVPIMTNTAATLKTYLREYHLVGDEHLDSPLFQNQRHEKMTRSGITYIVNKYAHTARSKSPLIPISVTPHIFRHSKAMHLCQAGIDTIYIRDILGHVDLKTTEIYAKINMEQVRDALEKAYPDLPASNLPDWQDNHALMNFLVSL